MQYPTEHFEILVPRTSFGRTTYSLVKLQLVQTRESFPIREANWLHIATLFLSHRDYLHEGMETIVTQEDCLLYLLTHPEVTLTATRGQTNARH